MKKTILSVNANASSSKFQSYAYWQERIKEYLDPPGIVNPTVGLFLGGYTIAFLAIWQWYKGVWPLPVLVGLAFLALHMEGTVIHDACHKAAHPNRWINQAMGHGAAILLGFSFPVFTRVHLQHHSNVNDPKNDPDHIVSTFGPVWLIAPRFFYHEYFFFQRKLWRKYELMQWGMERALFITIVIAGIKFNFMNVIYNLWFGPALMVGVTLGIFFDYLPHRPFMARNKWKNARVYPSRVMNILIMGQNYHLVHHLWPSIPWFEYKPAYEEAKPLLDQKGSPQRMGIFESKKDGYNFLYDILIGIRSHKKSRSKMRPLASIIPNKKWRKRWISLLHKTAVIPE
ncbi:MULTISPECIES: beta-carotene hydroxylase [unclassified Prochlorococcus]|uniref:beta-carotene hydroxylase n=1 Tax=unclassified Prochlorococcus TaxID=2627481 RepID=UPI000533A03E|nr:MULTISPECIES: fatty acid desaturase [unclassified Prochlorococcus]KGG16695.1 Beta-carotene hydroxylase [Prochlorococcus sp. MIT 0602]KGG18333.1 Beta-carotene hydroxylase [Prochlorococcus sp. MIT 0603]